MKKYLMMGAAALMMGASFTSCSNDKDLYDPTANALKFLQDYQAAFISVFGQPAANQTWGFGDAAQSRVTRSVNANGNEWGSTYKVPTELTAEQKDIVRQYFQQNKIKTYEDPQWTDYFMQQVYKGHTNTDGSLSDEQYRSANNGWVVGSDHMDHLAACNADGTIKDHIYNYNFGTCSTYPNVLNTENVLYNSANGNYHADEIQLMVSSTTAKFGYFNSDGSLGHTDYTSLVSWETIRTWANDKGLNGDCLNDGWNRSFMGFDFEQVVGEDIFAHTNEDLLDEDGNVVKDYKGNNKKQIRYLKYSDLPSHEYAWDGTSQYGYKVDASMKDDFVLLNGQKVPLLVSETNQYCGVNGDIDQNNMITSHSCESGTQWDPNFDNGDGTKGKYVPYYQNQNCLNLKVLSDKLANKYLPVVNSTGCKWVQVKGGADEYYSDWIVCLTKADPVNKQEEPTKKSIRIMAEDVAANAGSDIDFNDVVFDVEATFPAGVETVNTVTITLRAAGGTMPLYIGDVEVHNKLGISDVRTMINTNAEAYADGVNYFAEDGVAPKTFELAATVRKDYFLTDVNNNVVITVNNNDNVVPVLAHPGEPTAKIAVPVGTPWAKEKVNMGDAFSLFREWVKNAMPEMWYNSEVDGMVIR